MAQAVSTLAPPKSRRPSLGPRELGVYELPDGRQYVVSAPHPGGCALYSLRAWAYYGEVEYWADRGGRLLRRGIPTGLGVRDLKDTGRTSTYPKPSIL